ncbi:MAG: PQQ-binding-like beta-propeller repeat protein [Planctomycetota bacterium]
MKRLTCAVGTLLFVLFPGCSRADPVEKISVESSGMEVRDQETWLEPSDWPGWRGPNHDGTAIDQPIVTRWDDASNIVWQADVPGRGHSSPVVVGEQVFLTTALEDQQQQRVLAHDRRSGEALWSTLVHEGGFPSEDRMHAKSSHANATVACDGRRIYAAFLNGGRVWVTALDVSGNIAWQTDTGPFDSKYGYAPSPIIHRSVVIVAADHQKGGYLAALDRDTGEIAWRARRPALSSYSSPFVGHVAGESQLLICGCDQVAGFDPDTGRSNWSCPGTTESTCGTMVTDGTNVFASGGHPGHETICVRGDGSGKVVWRNDVGMYEPSLLLAGDHLFTVADKGIAYCWTAATGKLQWRERLRGPVSASPVLCNGLILVSNLRGTTFVFEADGDDFQLVSENQLGDDCYTSFALSDGWMFTRVGVKGKERRQERLYCIGNTESLSDGVSAPASRQKAQP